MKVLRPEIAELGEKFKRTHEEAARNNEIVQQSRSESYGWLCAWFIANACILCLFQFFPSELSLTKGFCGR
jgi:hypothetical protein